MFSSLLSQLKYASADPPFKLSVWFETEFALLGEEGKTRKGAEDYVLDVAESLSVLKPSAALLYAFWFLLLYALFRNARALLHPAQNCPDTTNYVWLILRAIFHDIIANPSSLTARILIFLLSISIGAFVVYYNGLFSTDLVVQEKGAVIDSIEDLVKAEVPPCLPKGYGVEELLHDSKDYYFRKAYELFRAHRERAAIDIDAMNAAKTLAKIQSGWCVVVTLSMALDLFKLIYCCTLDDPLSSRLHLGKHRFGYTLGAWLVNRNINSILEQRLDNM